MSEDKPKEPLEIIREMMKARNLVGEPRDYLVLSGWNRIQSYSQTFEVGATLPEKLEVDDQIWVMERADSPDLIEVIVIEDRGTKLWVKKPDNSVHFLVEKDNARPTPIPLRHTMIHKTILHRYIGKRPAENILNSMFEKRMAEKLEDKSSGNGHLDS